MSQIVLVDTTVFLNILDVPAFNQSRLEVLNALENLVDTGVFLLLPIAAIIETGNHIAQLADGRERRRFARQFCDQVAMAVSGDAPWRAMKTPDLPTLTAWLDDFPDHAMRGVGIGDLSIIKEWEETCRLHVASRVRVWSLDHSFAHCDREPDF